jgi:hypothetical protein
MKSGGGGAMVAVTVAEWLKAPEVPVNVTMALPAAALTAAVTVTVCAVPGVKLSVAGCAVTPMGSPAIATLTIPVKPLAGTAFTLICCPVPPGTSEMLAGVVVRVKSLAAEGLEPPPQEVNRSKERKLIHPARVFEEALIANPRDRPVEFTSIWSASVSYLPTTLPPDRSTDCHKVVSIGQMCRALSDFEFERLNC